MHAYWWKAGFSNFGDELTHEILKFLGVSEGWSAPADADLVVTGSVLEHLPEGWAGTVCGAGKLRPESAVDLANAQVLALRGKLTLAGVQGVDPNSVVLGDPGLLIPRWVRQFPAKHELGIVPHWSDKELHSRFRYGHLIDPTKPAIEVVSQIAQCKRIISSSLHGLIVADAYGIPRQAELFPNAHREGGDFKYRDYASVYDDTPHFGEMWTAPHDKVRRIQEDLLAALTVAVGQEFPPKPAPRRPDILQAGVRPQISLLVPFRDDGEYRSRVLDWLTRYWLSHLPSAEIVIGYDGGQPFSKAAAVNDAARRARGRVFVILDADAYLRPSAVQDCADAIDEAVAAGKRKWFMPYSHFYRIGQWETLCLLQSDPTNPYEVSSPPPEDWLESIEKPNHAGAHRYGALIQVMPREAFAMVGGMDQRMAGWGNEDVAMLRSLDTLYCQHEVAINDALHLWHSRPGTDYLTRRWIGQPWTPANSRLAQRYATATGEPALMQGLVDERRSTTWPMWLPEPSGNGNGNVKEVAAIIQSPPLTPVHSRNGTG